MDPMKLLQMVWSMILRRLLRVGVTKGIEMAAGKGKPAAQMTKAERKAAKSARQAVKRARQAAAITRRMR
ncbi:hypothetical protein FBT96_10765 [Rhodobacter capsulatus]|uniref:Uncharacterized protein n=1 Tax=Rhodobacter capsulatus TaxID=1061 RepID=A0A4U1JRY7_RHOCA|nr:hypothetical protein [Rhodobacter capsulatus]TKD18238.1 hypothetical protein FBT96_10765 [Rhodobacter capsulatus]